MAILYYNEKKIIMYVNPIEILELTNIDDTSIIDNEIIKKQSVSYLLILICLIMEYLNIMGYNSQKVIARKPSKI